MPGLGTTPDESGLKPPSGGAVHSPGIYARARPALRWDPPNTFPSRRVYLVVNMPITTRAILDRPHTQTATDRLGRLFDAHHERLFRLARRLSSDREEARDLVQEAFLRAARQPWKVPEGDQPEEAWLVRTLVNLCRDRFRRLVVRSRAASEIRRVGLEPVSQHPEEAVVARATVQSALACLSARRRAVVVLHELEGVAVREVARLLGVAEVTVRWHLLAARRDLASLLLKEDPK
jgi:RNA polymerase sigma-70 factor (ECF subfamily)